MAWSVHEVVRQQALLAAIDYVAQARPCLLMGCRSVWLVGMDVKHKFIGTSSLPRHTTLAFSEFYSYREPLKWSPAMIKSTQENANQTKEREGASNGGGNVIQTKERVLTRRVYTVRIYVATV